MEEIIEIQGETVKAKEILGKLNFGLKEHLMDETQKLMNQITSTTDSLS